MTPSIQTGLYPDTIAGDAPTLRGSVPVGERYIVLGWELARDERRHFTGTAIFTESGDCRACARATWFEKPLAS